MTSSCRVEKASAFRVAARYRQAASGLDWSLLGHTVSTLTLAFTMLEKGRKKGDGGAWLRGARTLLREYTNLARDLSLPQLKSHLHRAEQLLTPLGPHPAVDSSTPSPSGTDHVLVLLREAHSHQDSRHFVQALAGGMGALRMESIVARLTGPFDPLGEAFLQAATVLDHHSRTYPKGNPSP